MFRKLGLRQVYLCTKGTLTTTPNNAYVPGYRGEATLEITEHNEIKTVLNQNLGNNYLFKVSVPSYQCDFGELQKLSTLLGTGVDMQVQSLDMTNGGNFNFVDDASPGLVYDISITPKERVVKLDLAIARPVADALTLISAASSNVAKSLSGLGSGNYAVSSSKVHPPRLISITLGGSQISPIEEILDFNLSIKVKDDYKTMYDKVIPNYYAIKFDLTAADATISNLYSKLSLDRASSLVLTLYNNAGSTESITFNSAVLGRADKVDIGDKKGSFTMSFEADIPIQDCSFGSSAISIG